MLTVTRKTAVFAAALLLMLLAGCATTNRIPAWVLDNNAVFNPKLYITAVGEGPTMQSAQADATQALARVLQQQVQATTNANRNMSETMDGTEVSRSLEQLVQITTDINVTGLRIQENYCHTDKATGAVTWYAVALLDREEAGAWYSEQIIQNGERIFALQAASEAAELQHHGFTALQLIRSAEELARTTDEEMAILSVISKDRFTALVPVWQTADSVQAQRNQLEKSLIFGVSITNDYDQRIAKAVQSVFAAENLDCTLEPDTATAGVFTGELTITPYDSVNAQNNKYVRYTLTGSLVDSTGIEQLPLTITGREAHVTTEEAAQRAVRTVETELKKQLTAALQKELQ